MKILIVSDTHGRHEYLEAVLEQEKPLDMLIHLGDLDNSGDYIEVIAECPVEMIAGNNDFFSDYFYMPEYGEELYRYCLRMAKSYLEQGLLEKKGDNLKLTPTNDNLTDVELIEISQCNKTEFENDIYIAYDYDLKNEYLYKDGIWYEVNITNKLNKLLIQTLNDATKYNYCPDITWKVQTRYFAEIFDDTDLDKLIFRYNVHWRPSEKFEERDINFRSTGFKNTYPMVIDNSEQAIHLAAKEMGYENPIGVVFYDKTCGYWMVELYDQKSYDNEQNNSICSCAVYILYLEILSK